HRTSSRSAASRRRSATPCSLAASGSPTPRWRRSWRGQRDDAAQSPSCGDRRTRHRGRCRDGAELLSVVSVMTRERLYLFDTTLRDGAQMNGVDFTLHDKLAIAKLLDELGVDYIEGGYPGANPTDTDLFSQERKL